MYRSGVILSEPSVEYIRFIFDQPGPKTLEREQRATWTADLLMGQRGDLMRNRLRRAGGFSQQLRMTCIVERDIPPGGGFDAGADGQDTVILEDDGFV